jgi:polyhydroxyalkanoate synthase subunit PhaC
MRRRVPVSPNDGDRERTEQTDNAGGPETGLVAPGMDMGDFLGSMASVLTRAALRPAEVAAASVRFGANLAQIGPVAYSRWLGQEAQPPFPPDPKDTFDLLRARHPPLGDAPGTYVRE